MKTLAQTPVYRRTLRAKAGRFSISFFQYLALSIAAILSLAPLVLMWLTAFKTREEIALNPLALPKSLNLSNLVDAWTTGHYSLYARNSIIVTVPTVLCILALSCLAGYGFARLNFIGKKVFFYLFLLGLMVPFQSFMIPLFFDLQKWGLLQTYWALILPSIGLRLPFGIYMMQAFFRGISTEISDAARADGCNEFQVFWHVILPLTAPAVSSLAIFESLWTWNSFLMPLIYLNSENLRTLPLGMMFFQSKYVSMYNLISAGVLITSFPIIVLFLLLQRRFLRGLTMGAVKG